MSNEKPRQSLLHVGSVTRDALERLAASDGTRWQDLARDVLKQYVLSKSETVSSADSSDG